MSGTPANCPIYRAVLDLGADIGMDDSVFASLSDSTQMQRLIKILQIVDQYGKF